MKKTKKLLGILLCVSMIFSIWAIEGIAAGPLDGQVVDGSFLTSDLKTFDEKELVPENPFDSEIIPFGNYLSNGNVGLMNKGNGVIYLSGETSCYRTCDSVTVDLYLERLSNGNWYTVTSQPHIEYNTYFASNGLYLSVAKGYYYRARGMHIAKKGVSTESVATCSNGIFID